MPETISNAELVWLLMSLSTVVFGLVAISSTVVDKKRLHRFDPLYDKKIAIVNWCFTRHCFTIAIGLLFVIVTLNSFFTPQLVEWNPAIVALTAIPALLNLKIINDVIRKRNLLKSLQGLKTPYNIP